LIEAAGTELRCLRLHSPDINSIENAFAKPKALLRKAVKLIVEGRSSAIGELLPTVKTAECRN
jgi:transposase